MRRFSVFAAIVLFFATPLLTPSCTNLDEEVFSQLTEQNFPKTDEEFISALGAAYTNLYGLLNHNAYFSMQEVSSDEMMIPQRGSDWFDGGIWLRAHRHESVPADGPVEFGWNFCYAGISNCNRLIELFEGLVADGQTDAEDAAGFIAELKVLRGLFYYWLLDSYGNVPIVTGFAEAEAQPATVNRSDVYAFLESELEANVPLLTREKNSSTYARVNYYVGQALLAKLYLNAEVYKGSAEWAKASAACDEIINSGLYALESNYFANFASENGNSVENIFVIPYDRVFATGFNLPQMTLHYGSQATFDLQQQPWNGYCSLQEFYNSYEEGDVRRDGPAGRGYGNFITGPQFASDGTTPIVDSDWEQGDPSDPSLPVDPDGEQVTFTPEINEHFPNALRQAGARVGKYEFAIGQTPDLDNDFPIFRYADVILMKAEAAFRQGNNGEALALANQVRTRAGVMEFDAITADDLLAERGREMFYEGWRRSDLVRFGAYGSEWDFKPTSDATKEVFPIPQNQLQANPNLVQNPGYN